MKRNFIISIEDDFPVIPNGVELLKGNIDNIVKGMEKVKSITESKFDINCINQAILHISLIDIDDVVTCYKRHNGCMNIDDELKRGYDLAISYLVHNNDQELADITYTFLNFLKSGNIRKIKVSTYYYPDKEISEWISNTNKELEKEARKRDIEAAESWKRASEFILPIAPASQVPKRRRF